MGFDPITMAAVAMAGATLSAAGTYGAGHANSEKAAYQAQVARNNAIIADRNAQWATETGAAEGSAQGMKTRAGAGRLKAAQGSGGVDVNTGSSAAVQASFAALGELDQLTIRSNTARKVYGFNVEKQSQESAAKLYDWESDSAEEGAVLSAMGSLLSSASSVGGRYAQMQRFAPTGTA